MTTTIVRWGNSRGIRLPKLLLESVNLTDSDTVEVLTENGSIIIKKSKVRTHKSLKNHLEEYYKKDIKSILNDPNLVLGSREIDYGNPVGEEIW